MSDVKYTYIVDRDASGQPDGLLRLCNDGARLWGEVYDGGQWTEDDAALSYLREPPVFGDYIDADEASRIAAVLDGRDQPR